MGADGAAGVGADGAAEAGAVGAGAAVEPARSIRSAGAIKSMGAVRPAAAVVGLAKVEGELSTIEPGRMPLEAKVDASGTVASAGSTSLPLRMGCKEI